MRRRWLLLGVGTVALLIAGIESALVMLVPPDPISPENAARIREGMTVEQVEGMLGGRKATATFVWGPKGRTCIWSGDRGHIVVDLNQLRVSGSGRFSPEERGSFLGWLRRLLPW